MNTTLYNEDGRTHFKIIALGLLGGLLVIWISIAANFGADKTRLQLEASFADPSAPSTSLTIRR